MGTSEENRIMARLNAFEKEFGRKMDKLAEAVLTVARVEERQTQCQLTCNKTSEALWGHINSIYKRLRNIENNASVANSKIGSVERIFWIAVTAIMGAIIAKIV